MKRLDILSPHPLDRIGAAAVLVLGFLLLAGCGSRVESCLCETTASCLPPETERQSETPGLRTEVRDGAVYLDLSYTMRGFIAERGYDIPFTRLQEMLRTTLPEAFVEVDLGEPAFHGFGGQMVDSAQLAPMQYYAIRSPDGIGPRQRYDQGQTDVAGMLERSADSPGTLSVIVTDNAQDVLRSGGRRVPGFDRSSFVKVVTERLHGHGFGVWLIGIQDDFQGNYFSIQPVFNQDGVKLNNPIPLKGRRPLYCWVISKDVDKGRRFVQHLLGRLPAQALANGDAKSDIHAIELSPGVLPDLRIVEPNGAIPQNGETTFTSIHWFRVQDWVDGGDSDSSFICLSFARTAQSMRHRFPLLGVIAPTSRTDLRRTLRLPDPVWNVEVKASGKAAHLQGLQFVPVEAEVQSAIGNGSRPSLSRTIVLNPASLAGSDVHDQYLDLSFYSGADLSELPDTHWISAWSTRDDTTPESILGKTLYLEDIVLGILRNTVGEPQPSHCVRLCFARYG